MLPSAVRRHLDVPYFFVGSETTGWTADRVHERAEELCLALTRSLAAVAADERLGKGGNADLTDRPATKGEEITAALRAYRDFPGSSQLNGLRNAVVSTRLWRHIEALEKWRARKRPSHGGRSIEYEIACVLGEIGRSADDYHYQPASYDFLEQRRAAE
jgi:hypothetical protein